SFSPWMNALRLSLWLDDDPGERHPIRQDLPACCARAATDQVAAVPARSVMNVRLRMSASISGDAIIAAQTRALIEAETNESQRWRVTPSAPTRPTDSLYAASRFISAERSDLPSKPMPGRSGIV